MTTRLSPEKSTLIIARNDGEAVAVIDLATRFGFDVRISAQRWGATLEKEPESTFVNLRESVIVVEMPGPDEEKDLRLRHTLIIIDHHKYPGFDRFNAKSSLEQFADLIEYPLTRWEMGVALNDRGYIPALVAANYPRDEIEQIRRFDLAAQGYMEDDFCTLEADYSNGRARWASLYVVLTARERTSYLADIHYWKYAGCNQHPDLLVLTQRENGLIEKASFSGRADSAKNLYQSLGGFCGGNEAYSMYWGKEYPESIDRDRMLLMIDKALGRRI